MTIDRGWPYRHVLREACDLWTAEALAWQAERRHFRAWAGMPGAPSRAQLRDVCLEAYMRMIFLADDPDPEVPT